MSKRERVKREKKRNGWIIAGMIAAVLLVFFFGAGILLPNDRIASGISVDGIDLGNKTEEEAKAVLENASLSVRSISITSGGQTLEIQPEEISLGIDPVMTAKNRFHQKSSLLPEAIYETCFFPVFSLPPETSRFPMLDAEIE